MAEKSSTNTNSILKLIDACLWTIVLHINTVTTCVRLWFGYIFTKADTIKIF